MTEIPVIVLVAATRGDERALSVLWPSQRAGVRHDRTARVST